MRDRRQTLAAGRNAWLALAAATVVASGAVMLFAPHGDTYAAYSDFADVHGAASAGTWQPSPPPQCAGMTFKHILYVPSDGRPFEGTNKRDLIFGSPGDDVIDGGNGKDCIVGGAGDDQIDGGNGKDVLLGGSGDDDLEGSNGPDILVGGDGYDICNTGHAPDNASECESVDPPPGSLHVAHEVLAPSTSGSAQANPTQPTAEEPQPTRSDTSSASDPSDGITSKSSEQAAPSTTDASGTPTTANSGETATPTPIAAATS